MLDRSGGLDTAGIPREPFPFEALQETAPAPCRWPTLAITELTMREADAALAADPLFHRCPDGQHGPVDVRYWYFRPLNFSCRHCAGGGGVCVVAPETVGCGHWMAPRTDKLVVEG